MTVMLKGLGGPDNKKFYDFDQVFAGTEGNSQVDVFKDTKHLIMSVIDGYNVCIFAYGQTGAGNSITASTLLVYWFEFRKVIYYDRECGYRFVLV